MAFSDYLYWASGKDAFGTSLESVFIFVQERLGPWAKTRHWGGSYPGLQTTEYENKRAVKVAEEKVNSWELTKWSTSDGIPKETELVAQGQIPEAEQVGLAGEKTMTKTFCEGLL